MPPGVDTVTPDGPSAVDLAMAALGVLVLVGFLSWLGDDDREAEGGDDG